MKEDFDKSGRGSQKKGANESARDNAGKLNVIEEGNGGPRFV